MSDPQGGDVQPVKLLKADDVRAWLRTSDQTIHIGEHTFAADHALRIANDILELLQVRAVPALTADDIGQIIEGLEHFCKGPVEDAELDAIWDPYIAKLRALKAAMSDPQAGAVPPESFREQVERVIAMCGDDGDTWDLSPNDQAALKAVLERMSVLDAEVERLKAAGAVPDGITALRERWLARAASEDHYDPEQTDEAHAVMIERIRIYRRCANELEAVAARSVVAPRTTRKFYEDVARTPFEAFGHNEFCARWVESADSISLDRSRVCTCGGQEAHPDGPEAVVAPRVPRETPEEKHMEEKPLTGLWRKQAATPEGKYLIKRRDGTVVDWPNFVLGARDPAAPAALRAYADAGEAAGFNATFVADVRALADEFEQYRQMHGAGDPDRGRHRIDDPATIEEMRHGRSA